MSETNMKKYRDALEKVITTLEKRGNGYFVLTQVDFAITYAKQALKDDE